MITLAALQSNLDDNVRGATLMLGRFGHVTPVTLIFNPAGEPTVVPMEQYFANQNESGVHGLKTVALALASDLAVTIVQVEYVHAEGQTQEDLRQASEAGRTSVALFFLAQGRGAGGAQLVLRYGRQVHGAGVPGATLAEAVPESVVMVFLDWLIGILPDHEPSDTEREGALRVLRAMSTPRPSRLN